jgi:predicted phage replisome organizer
VAEVKWIKLNVGMFDGNSFKKIKKAKIGGESFRDKLTAVWFELMDFAGKCNAGGQLIESPEIPFSSIEDIAIMIDREEEELNLCMQYYINNRMITVIDDIYMLTNWSKYQNEEGLEKIREQTRNRVAKHRKQQKLLSCNVTGNVTVTQSNATDKEEDLEKEKEKEKDVAVATGDGDDFDKFELIGGTLGKGVVFMTRKQQDELIDQLGFDAFNHYIGRMADFIIKNNASVSNQFAMILKWAREDAKV